MAVWPYEGIVRILYVIEKLDMAFSYIESASISPSEVKLWWVAKEQEIRGLLHAKILLRHSEALSLVDSTPVANRDAGSILTSLFFLLVRATSVSKAKIQLACWR